MFALGALFLLGLFAWALLLVSKRLPAGWPRMALFLAVASAGVAYPFLHRAEASYSDFQTLCARPDRYQVLKPRTAAYIYLDPEFTSDCSQGPAFIEKRGYLGFDCQRKDAKSTALYRYTKNARWRDGCGLECFDAAPQPNPETDFKRGYRYGYIKSGAPVVAYAGTAQAKEYDAAKLVFHDRLLLDDGDMAVGRDYTYYPYGNGWAKLLGLASGSAPSESCATKFIPMDHRDVYTPPPPGDQAAPAK